MGSSRLLSVHPSAAMQQVFFEVCGTRNLIRVSTPWPSDVEVKTCITRCWIQARKLDFNYKGLSLSSGCRGACSERNNASKGNLACAGEKIWLTSMGMKILASAAGGRLECTMQNIADNFMNTYNYRCSKGIESELNTFIVYNERKRVTSSAKRKLKSEDRSLHQTPEGSLLDIMRNAHDLLSSCSIDIPMVKDNSEYLHSGPPFLIFLHPALGPFWDIIRQKFVGGSISKGSELQIEVAEFLWKDVELDGSLIILAGNIMGSTKKNKNGEQILHYGSRCGRCRLQSVKIVNEGINWTSSNNVYWKHDVERSESVKIILHGNAEFEAKDVVLKGNHVFEVPDGHRMCIIQDRADRAGFVVKLDLICDDLMDSGTWHWKYAVDGVHVKLNMVEL